MIKKVPKGRMSVVNKSNSKEMANKANATAKKKDSNQFPGKKATLMRDTPGVSQGIQQLEVIVKKEKPGRDISKKRGK